jgi:bacteriocin-like protein
MASNSNTQKPATTDEGLSEKELAKVVGGFNPQPDPPAVVAKSILDFGIRSAALTRPV